MCPTCDRLRAELREVKEELAEWRTNEADEPGDVALIGRQLGLNPQPARIVSRLMASSSRVVAKEALIETMNYAGEGRDLGGYRGTDEGCALKVVITKARRGLESVGLFDAISNVVGVGYIMPKSKAVELRAILEAA